MATGTYTSFPIQWESINLANLGISNDVKTALLQIAQKVAYIDDEGATYYQALYDALYPTIPYTITNTLTGCTSSNAAAVIADGDPYTATITASFGYSLTGATVSITMGGSDITASAYNAGTISIASVTGDLSITVTAVAVTLSSISAVYTQSGTVYWNDSLDSLKDDLVVTATYSDSSTAVIPSTDYTLSGTLTLGTTSTITVSYSGKTTTFNVVVSDIVYLLGADDFGTAEYPIGGLADKYSATGVVNYQGVSNKTRLAYIPFDLTIIGGHTYELTLETDEANAGITCTYYNETALGSVSNHTNIASTNYVDGAWPAGKVFTVQTPATLNSSPVVCIRISVRKSSSNPTITTNFITSVTIRDVTT